MNNIEAVEELIDLEPTSGNLLTEVLVGLSKSQKSIPPKYLYDKKGSEIFEVICRLPEYYPTRAENEILEKYANEIVELIGPSPILIEPGSGSGEKIRHILKALNEPATFVPIEISKEILLRMTSELHETFPEIRVIPICADFTQNMNFPLSIDSQKGRRVVFFPGSTIGNFEPQEALSFLKSISKLIDHNGALLIGVDLKKDRSVFELAYDDPQGVTAAFNLNLLDRLNREINASFNLMNFHHQAFYNEALGRVEMHLRSIVPQLVKVNGSIFRFREGETIHTESSYKYTVEEFCELSAKANLRLIKNWKDSNNLFCVYCFEKG
jgi:dimethylhistidine N-methyltransferase